MKLSSNSSFVPSDTHALLFTRLCVLLCFTLLTLSFVFSHLFLCLGVACPVTSLMRFDSSYSYVGTSSHYLLLISLSSMCFFTVFTLPFPFSYLFFCLPVKCSLTPFTRLDSTFLHVPSGNYYRLVLSSMLSMHSYSTRSLIFLSPNSMVSVTLHVPSIRGDSLYKT